MSKKRRICVLQVKSRIWIIMLVNKSNKNDKDLELQLIATGMHLSKQFGLTYREIEKNFKIKKKINIQIKKDTSLDISRSMSIAQTSFSKAYNKLKPDIVVLLGDRYEIFSAASSAMISQIPIAHIHGGEVTTGSWDDSIRHCITKMSHIHFVATSEYRQRVIQLGEDPKKVFNIGGLGIENIKKLKLLNRKNLKNQ